ncbi:MAG: hypothetical protein NTY38_30930, partial [Acidobacteria bacterium]|nr:hypothetical protein [Acidobacteriota bacterium]
ERFFCKYACPLGAVIGILSKAGITRLERHPQDCKACNVCHKECFAHVDFLSTAIIRDSDCNHCLDCVSACPKPNVLVVRAAAWRFSHATYAVLLVLGLAATISVSKVYGAWRTRPAAVAFTNSAGKPDADQMRGWMTLGEISTGYGIPLATLRERAGLPASVAASTRVNQIARTYGLDFEPDKLREVVRSYLAGPGGKPGVGKTPSAGKTAGHGDEQEVKGFMTLDEVALKTGVPKEYILKSLGAPADTDPRKPLREWLHGQGKSIQDVRDGVAAYRAR